MKLSKSISSQLLSTFLIVSFFMAPLAPIFAQEAVIDSSVVSSSETEITTDPITDQSTTNTPVVLEDLADIPDPKTLLEENPAEETPTDEVPVDPDPQMMMSMQASEVGSGLPPSTIKQALPQANDVYGSLTYSYPIKAPPGRNGMQPDLALNYASHTSGEEGSVLGAGWSVNIPYIERINRKGTDKLYTENYFNSSLSGELVNTSGSIYKAKVDNGDYLEYTLSSNVWTVRDKSGTVYKFGTNAAERQDNSGDTSKVYKWMLQEVRDLNDNYIKYEYTKDAGQIYPYKITYTGNGSTDGIFQVEFLKDSRSDATTNYKPGFAVTTSYKIYEIDVKISGSWVNKYELAYTTARNGRKILLNTITQTGKDESSNTISLPATDFDYQTSVNTWTTDTNWTSPVDFSLGVIVADVNGDSLPDLLQYHVDGGTTKRYAYLNTGSGWTSSSTWLPPSGMEFYTVGTGDRGVRAADVNGDGLTDLLQSEPSNKKTYINNGAGWTLDTTGTWDSYSGHFDFVEGTPRVDSGSRLVDINGDGLPDFIKGKTNGGSFDSWVATNTGAGWSTNTNWTVPLDTRYGVIIADVNGDNLADLIQHYYTAATGTLRTAYINNGAGWSSNSSWLVPTDMEFYTENTGDRGVRAVDVNADGQADLMQSEPTYKRLLVSNGAGWTTDTNWDDWNSGLQFVEGTPRIDGYTRAIDIDGDGITDLIKGKTNSGTGLIDTTTQRNVGTVGDEINKITYPRGGYTDITYKATPLYTSGGSLLNPNLPFILDTLYQVVNNDGLSGTATYTYGYEGGRFYFNDSFDRKYSGFNKITKTNSASYKTTNFYHQGNSTDSSNGEYSDDDSKIGKIYRTEIADNSGNIYKKIINKWENYSPNTGRDFVKLTQSIGMTYDGDSDHKDLAKTYTYDDANGNLTQQIEWGEVTGADAGTYTDTGSDKFTTDIAYASNTSPSILGLPKQEVTVDQSSNKVRENKYYYDAQSYGGVLKGNLTKQEKWKTSTTYIDYEKTYDGTYGLVATEKDPRDKTTTYSYDSYNLYPASVTNPFSQVTSYTYDYSLGKPKQVTDVNSRVFQTVYDALDRPIEEKQPDLTTPSTLVTKTAYTYTGQTIGNKIQKTDYLDGSTTVDTYTYTDGFDRPIQTRKEMEDGNYATTDVVYNNIEQVHKESLPYSSSGTSKTSATTSSDYLTTYSYDPMLRVSSVVNIIGTITNAYDDWKTSVTDLRSKTKHYYKDAYENLVRVDEVNSGSTYSTYYEWNGNKKLTKITDALNNIRNFTYDGLGRRLTAEDLHASGDGTYGTWTYTYDDTGNLTQTVDPKSQTVNYTYDDTDRVLTEDYTGNAGTEVSYTYDSGTDGTGRLTSVTAPGANTSYVYNPHGKVKQETKTISSTSYQTDYTFDRQGNTLEITNPDSSKVKYTYNTAGQLETIQRKESSDGSYTDVVTDFDYGAHGKVTYQANQNGSSTTKTYDATKLYRLSRIQTGTGGTSSTTLTFYPVPGTTVDGRVRHSETNSTWSTLVSGAGNGAGYTSTDIEISLYAGTTSGKFDKINRGIILFDSSALPDDATITSSTLSVYGFVKYDGLGASPNLNVYSSNPASNTTLTGTDYATLGSTAFATAISYSSFSDSAYNNFALNSSGISNISKTGISKFGLRNANYDAANSAPSWVNGDSSQLTVYSSDEDGTSKDPKLSVTYETSSPTVALQDLSYTYDNNGNITEILDDSDTDSSKEVDYVYDDLNRLTSATATNVASGQSTYTHTYTYDAIGNLTNKSDLGNYSYAGTSYANPHAATSINSVTQTYDNNGNLTGDTIWTHTWDYKNRITQSAKTGTTVTYAYDHNGSRVREDNGTTNVIIPTQNYSKEGSTHVKHIYAGNELVATVKGTGGSAVAYYIHTDHLGSSSVITDSTATVKELSDYFAYGEPRIHQTSSFDDRKGYIGQEYDEDTQLSYLNARYYNGARGQFISQDPVFWELGISKEGQQALSDPQSMNSYSYAGNNPIKNSDPDGRWYKEVLTGQQSWSSFSGEVGQATQYMGGGWQTAMDHPYVAGAAVGVGGGAAFAVGATVATGASLEYASGWGTQSMGNLTRLGTLPQTQLVPGKLAELSTRTGQSTQAILQEASKVGKSFVDYASKGNINTYIEQSAGKLTRITTNPEVTRIISAGTAKASQLVNNLANGRQVPLSNSTGVGGLIRGIINALGK